MSTLQSDLLTKLAFTLHESPGVFALLLGSGLSRSAQIPTGWEITLDLVRIAALANGVEDQTDWAAWYRETTGRDPNYSEVLGELAGSPSERRSILNRYIEPNENDREHGSKLPTSAHRAITALVNAGYVRVIVTTNFDRLLETALREGGVEPTVVASVDAIKGAEPITHSRCFLLKLHGDYKDSRILNTEEELEGYPREYNALIDRIIDEYGFLVSGWSGAWDHALRAAFFRAANRRYSMFWTAHGELEDGARQIIAHRKASVIQIDDADHFFTSLNERIVSISESRQLNPQSVDVLINTAKRFVARHEDRVRLHDLFSEELRRLVERLDSESLTPSEAWTPSAFADRVQLYETATEALVRVVCVLGRWGEIGDTTRAVEIVRALYSHANSVRTGNQAFLNLRSYPAVLIFYTYALALTRARRWGQLYSFLCTELTRDGREQKQIVDVLFLDNWEGAGGDTWRKLPGFEKLKTPLSDYLFEFFLRWSSDFVDIKSEFEIVFERMEILATLVYFQKISVNSIKQAHEQQSVDSWVWMPVGRSGWHRSLGERLIEEICESTGTNHFLEAGFANNNYKLLHSFRINFERITQRMRY